MHFLLLYLTVSMILVFCMGAPRYLELVIFFTLLFFFPDSGNTIHDYKGWGNHYTYARGYTNTNPLYVRGYLRKKKKNFVFGSVKGLFVCQIAAVALVVLAWMYSGVRYFYGEIILVEKILIYSSILLVFIWSGLELYYQKCCDWSYQYTENAEGIWQPFCFLYQMYPASLYKNYFFCRYYVPYGEMKTKLVGNAEEKGYALSKCYQTDTVKNALFFTRRNGGALDILALIHIKQMQEGCWEVFNHIFELFWREIIADRYEKRKMTFTFLICVDEDSEELRKTKKQMCATVESKAGRYRLSALLDYSEEGSLHIASDCERAGNNKRCRQIRKDLMSMLGVSQKFAWKEYPEGDTEPECW